METRILVSDGAAISESLELPERPEPGDAGLHGRHGGGWAWIDVAVRPGADTSALADLAARFGLDQLAIDDAIADVDLPKLDDFDSHLLVVLHGLREDIVATYEIDCFLLPGVLITVRSLPSPVIDALRGQLCKRDELARLSADEVLALLADGLTRRLLSVLDAFDERIEDLTAKALTADSSLLEDLTAVRTDLTGVRRVVHPQRETLDVIRNSTSPLLSPEGRRRFSDVFDVASRAAAGLDEARAALAETLDAYRGAEAREATEVSKVLTVYAAIMLPLSLVAGFFGMNFVNLPWTQRRWGWVVVTLGMIVITLVSLGMFISLGWVKRPSGRRTGRAIGRGLLEATKAPVHIVGAMVEIGTMPIREATSRLTNRDDHD